MEKRFENALNATLEMMHAKDDNLCCAVYWDDMCRDNAIVMFMEYEGYGNMHAVMKDLHTILSSKLGHPVSVCHNDSTDEQVLIHGGATDAQVYYSDECCKMDTIRICKDIIIDGSKGYRDEYRSMAYAAQHIADNTDSTLGLVLERLDWNKAVLPQLIRILIAI